MMFDAVFCYRFFWFCHGVHGLVDKSDCAYVNSGFVLHFGEVEDCLQYTRFSK